MFYLVKKTDIKQCAVGERVMVLADFSGVLAGTKGTIIKVYENDVVIEWDKPEPGEGNVYEWCRVGRRLDSFHRSELEYLVFETKKYPNYRK